MKLSECGDYGSPTPESLSGSVISYYVRVNFRGISGGLCSSRVLSEVENKDDDFMFTRRLEKEERRRNKIVIPGTQLTPGQRVIQPEHIYLRSS